MIRTSCGQKVKFAPTALLLAQLLFLSGCGEAVPPSTQPNETVAGSAQSASATVDPAIDPTEGLTSDPTTDKDADRSTGRTKAPTPSLLAAGAAELSSSAATILVLGDSISAAYGIQREKGWVNLLQQYVRGLDEEFRVVNASISGETTGGGLARFAQSLAEHQPQITVIELGGNDGLRGYPLAQVKSNLTQLVQMAKAANSQVLVLGMQIPPNYGARYSNGFAQLFAEVAAAEQVPLVPSFLEKIALTPGMLQADGIHPVQAAQPMLLEVVLPELDKLLQSLLP